MPNLHDEITYFRFDINSCPRRLLTVKLGIDRRVPIYSGIGSGVRMGRTVVKLEVMSLPSKG